jgi:hypothetical protein
VCYAILLGLVQLLSKVRSIISNNKMTNFTLFHLKVTIQKQTCIQNIINA